MTVRYCVIDRTNGTGRAVRELAATAGTVLVDVPPLGRTRLAEVADATLYGLGKNPNLQGAQRTSAPLAAAWLSLGEHTDAIVCDAQEISDAGMVEVAEWFTDFGVTPWFLFTLALDGFAHRELQLPAHNWVDVTNATPASFDEFTATFAARVTVTAPDPHPVGTRLPNVDGLLFRQACRAELSSRDFNVLDKQLRGMVRSLRDELQTSISGPHRNTLFAGRLHEWLEDASTTDELVLRARAAQIAALTEGIGVRVDTPALLAAAVLSRRGLAESEQWWHQLDAYRDPDPGAIAALHHHEFTFQQIVDLRLGAIHVTDAQYVDVEHPDGLVAISGPPARFLAALADFRRRIGGTADSYAFCTSRTDHLSKTNVLNKLHDAQAALDITVDPLRADGELLPPVEWLKRYGITFHKLAKASA